MMLRDWNDRAIQEAIIDAYRQTVEELAARTLEVIEEVGAFPTHPDSDIVDTGELRDSQTLTWIGDTSARLEWDAPHAIFVNQGYVSRSGFEVAGRPWHTEALRRFNFGQKFASYLEL